jgi:hypothetical protein
MAGKLTKRASSKKMFSNVDLHAVPKDKPSVNVDKSKAKSQNPKPVTETKWSSALNLLPAFPARLESALSFNSAKMKSKQQSWRSLKWTAVTLSLFALVIGIGFYTHATVSSRLLKRDVFRVTGDNVQPKIKPIPSSEQPGEQPGEQPLAEPLDEYLEEQAQVKPWETWKPDVPLDQMEPPMPPLVDPNAQSAEEQDKSTESKNCIPADMGHPEIIDGSGNILNRTNILDPTWCTDQTIANSTLTKRQLNWRCIQSCNDANSFVRVADGGAGIGLMCSGSSAMLCSFYADAACARMISGSIAPVPGQGVKCTFPPPGQQTLWNACANNDACQSACCSTAYSNDGRLKCHPTSVCPPNGWCQEARNQLWMGVGQSTCSGPPPPPAPVTPVGVTKCVQSCSDGGNWVSVQNTGQAIQCAGPSNSQWYVLVTLSKSGLFNKNELTSKHVVYGGRLCSIE